MSLRLSEAPPIRRQHFLALDGLRGVAALLVMTYHISLANGYRQIAPLGFLAVDLFFLLSGFVIAKSYEQRFEAGLGVGRFMLLRLLRVYPLIFLGLLLGAAWSLIVGDGSFNALSAINFLILPVFFARTLFPFDGPVWSLLFELFANLAHVTILRRLGAIALLLVALSSGALLMTAMIHFSSASLGSDPNTFIAGFARVGFSYVTGIILYRRIRSREVSEWRVPLIVPIALLIGVLHGPPASFWAIERSAGIIFIIFPAILVISIHQRPTGRWATAMTWLGRLSFPLYAIHLPIVIFAAPLIADQPQATRLPLWILFVFLIGAAALTLEQRIDLPLRRWLGGWLSKGDFVSPQATSV